MRFAVKMRRMKPYSKSPRLPMHMVLSNSVLMADLAIPMHQIVDTDTQMSMSTMLPSKIVTSLLDNQVSERHPPTIKSIPHRTTAYERGYIVDFVLQMGDFIVVIALVSLDIGPLHENMRSLISQLFAPFRNSSFWR